MAKEASRGTMNEASSFCRGLGMWIWWWWVGGGVLLMPEMTGAVIAIFSPRFSGAGPPEMT